MRGCRFCASVNWCALASYITLPVAPPDYDRAEAIKLRAMAHSCEGDGFDLRVDRRGLQSASFVDAEAAALHDLLAAAEPTSIGGSGA